MLFNLFTRKKKRSATADTTADATVETVAPHTNPQVTETSAAAVPPAASPVAAPVVTPAATPVGSSVESPAATPVAEAPVAIEAELPQLATQPEGDLVAPEPQPVAAAESSKPLATLTVPQLRLRAKEMGITGYSRLTKADLVRVITDHTPL